MDLILIGICVLSAFILGVWTGLRSKYDHIFQEQTVNGAGNVVIQSGCKSKGDIVGGNSYKSGKSSKCQHSGASS